MSLLLQSRKAAPAIDTSESVQLALKTRRQDTDHTVYRLQPIQAPSIPYHTFTMGFIVGLLLTADGFDALLAMAEKDLYRRWHRLLAEAYILL